MHFILYSRSYCHLCDDMLQALNALMRSRYARYAFTIEVVDVDANQHLTAKYDERVPVLAVKQEGNQEGEAVELCHYFLDHAKISALFR